MTQKLRTPEIIALAAVLLLSLAVPAPVTAGPTSALSLYQQGMARMDAEDMFEAIILFKESLALNPRYLEPMLQLAEAYYYLDEYDEALRYVSMAIPLGKDHSGLLNIHGRILLALGKTDEAAAIFRSIQKREPYNVDALLGLAEFSLAKGDELSALKNYQKSLEYQSKNRRILLSLALMYESRNDRTQSETFLLKALDTYPENPLVQTLAGEYYLRRGQLKDAEFHASTALALHPSYPRGLDAMSKIYLAMKEYEKCLSVIDQIMQVRSQDPDALYMRAQALVKLGRIPEAVKALEATLLQDPSDEIARLVLEDLLMGNFPINDVQRERAAKWHFTQAGEFRKKNLYTRAEFHFRRGRQLAPLATSGLRSYAEFLKTMGRNAEFLDKLKLLKENGVNDSFVKDNLEVYTSLLAQSVSATWNVDQFTVERDPLVFRTFMIEADNRTIEHPEALEYLARYSQRLLAVSDKVTFRSAPDDAEVDPERVSSISDAFRIARKAGADYYVVVRFQESGDDFQAQIDLHLGRTGTKIRSYSAYRTGNFRVQGAIAQITDSIQKEAPLRGTLLARRVNDGFINLGKDDGIKAGDVLNLVSPGGYILQGEAPGFVYSEESRVGTITITRVDDKVSMGTISRNGFFDRINLGDTLLRDGESVVRTKDATSNFPYLYNQIRGIR